MDSRTSSSLWLTQKLPNQIHHYPKGQVTCILFKETYQSSNEIHCHRTRTACHSVNTLWVQVYYPQTFDYNLHWSQARNWLLKNMVPTLSTFLANAISLHTSNGHFLCTPLSAWLCLTSYNDMAQLLWHLNQMSHYIDSDNFSRWPLLHWICSCFPHEAPLKRICCYIGFCYTWFDLFGLASTHSCNHSQTVGPYGGGSVQ